jgi:hypothetical protein
MILFNRFMKRISFIKNILSIGFIFLGGSSLISSCGGKSDEEVKKNRDKNQLDCGKDLTSAEKKSREEYQYEEISAKEEELCNNCTHFRIPKKGEECGTCELVKGPINPLGYCNQWFKKAEAAA